MSSIINPAQAGLQEDIRAGLHYRKQWATSGSGYGTQAFAAEKRINRKEADKGWSGSLSMLNDQAGKAQIRTLSILLGSAYRMPLSSNGVFSAGIQAGYRQRSLDLAGLAWDAQYNGYEYDPSLSNQENYAEEPVERNMDAAIGLCWHQVLPGLEYNIGYSVRHFGQNQSLSGYYRDVLSPLNILAASAIHRDKALGWKGDIQINRQGKANQLILGLSGIYQIGSDSRYTDFQRASSLQAGLFYRLGESVIPMIIFDWKRQVSAAISYDLPLSGVNRITGIRGGPEISVVYSKIAGERRKIAQ
jgi:type IX secretion system PorP/SprF family membrane protein